MVNFKTVAHLVFQKSLDHSCDCYHLLYYIVLYCTILHLKATSCKFVPPYLLLECEFFCALCFVLPQPLQLYAADSILYYERFKQFIDVTVFFCFFLDCIATILTHNFQFQVILLNYYIFAFSRHCINLFIEVDFIQVSMLPFFVQVCDVFCRVFKCFL